jgi:hypothetical protein
LAADSALRATSDPVDQLQEQLRTEHAHHGFNLVEKETILARELAEVRYELARRDRMEAFACAPSPSTMMR